MLDEEFGSFDEEEEPESLRKKWDQENLSTLETFPCPHCGQLLRPGCVYCIFCEENVLINSGFLGRLFKWTREGFGWAILFITALLLLVSVLL